MLHLVLLMAVASFVAGETCRALSLGAGGTRGAYQAGALVTLTTLLPGEDVQWNVVSGMSAGSINAGGVSLFPMGQEVAMAQFLKSVWLHLNSSSVFVDWNEIGVPYAIFEEPSLYNNQPLKEYLTRLFTQGIHRNITIGVTDLSTGEFRNFNESVGNEDIVEAIMCAVATSVFFPPREFQGITWVDGGSFITMDVFSAVGRCLDVVSDPSDIIVDMIFCSGLNSTVKSNAGSMTTIEVYERIRNIKSYDSAMWYVYNAMQAYPEVHYRYIIMPSQELAGSVEPLDFSPSNLASELELGESDAQKVIESGRNSKEVVGEWYRQRTAKVRPYQGRS